MSFFSRFWNFVRRPTAYVGRDLEGNRFYEYPATSNDLSRTKRVLKPLKRDDMFAYASSVRRIPIQWQSWLTHTRADPPTLEELQADLQRQQRVQQNVVILLAKEREERLKLMEAERPQVLQSPTSAKDHPNSQTNNPSSVGTFPKETGESRDEDERRQAIPSKNYTTVPSVEPAETQPWSPRTTRRRD